MHTFLRLSPSHSQTWVWEWDSWCIWVWVISRLSTEQCGKAWPQTQPVWIASSITCVWYWKQSTIGLAGSWTRTQAWWKEFKNVLTFHTECLASSYVTEVVQFNNSVLLECAAYGSYRWWQSEDGCRLFSQYSVCAVQQCTVRIDMSRMGYLYYCCTAANVTELTSTTEKTCFEIDSKRNRWYSWYACSVHPKCWSKY